jgi:hypothetical protein
VTRIFEYNKLTLLCRGNRQFFLAPDFLPGQGFPPEHAKNVHAKEILAVVTRLLLSFPKVKLFPTSECDC